MMPCVEKWITRLSLYLCAILTVGVSTANAQSPLSMASEPGAVFQDILINGKLCTACPVMREVPNGTFQMGSYAGEGHNDENGLFDSPFSVTIPKKLAVGAYEVTKAQFRAFHDANPSYQLDQGCAAIGPDGFRYYTELDWNFPGFPQQDDHPVVCVSWRDATAFTAWLSQITGQNYRLLTEAEWEYSARAGSNLRYWWGDEIRPKVVNCLSKCQDGYDRTAPVTSFLGNGFGLFNILGNAWEWVSDCYDNRSYKTHPMVYPASYEAAGAGECNRVIRGGSWSDNPWSLRLANREGWKPQMPLHDVGFRVARVMNDLPL